MDEGVGLPDSTGRLRALEERVETLVLENCALKESNRLLRKRLFAQIVTVAQEQAHSLHMREANEKLVLATFGAEDSKVEAEAVNQRQTIFLSMLAHELRNPMAAIAVANTVLESLNLTHPRVAKLLAIVRRQIGHLVRLVDDLLDASRIMTGKISVQPYLIRLGDVIDGAMETVQPILTERIQTFQVDLPPSIALIGDHVRLTQLFSNLLINACKFSAPNTVVMISASVLGDELEVIIRDSGKGIALEHQTDIFALFSKGSEPMGGSLGGGLGIGLTLVRTIAEMHGGSVRVESKGVGCGSAFIVTLPLPANVAIREKGQSNKA